VAIEPNDWEPTGGRVVLYGRWWVTEVRRVNTTLLVRDLAEREDGTYCVSVAGSGEVTFELQKTNHPSGRIYRFPSAYQPGSTRVFVDGVLQVRGTEYFEIDPEAGYIELATLTYAPVTGTYWVAGASAADLGDFQLIIPTSGPITATFGPQSSLWPPYNWKGTYYEHFHNGVDFGVVVGTPVYASADGTAFWETQSAGGQMINIYHSPNIRTNYAHLSGRVVGNGAAVVQGQLIGYSGDSGIVTGAHLHWGLVVNGIPEDPMGQI
jgi:murein DD-endopeptidase MepM/ murein hydrolase activator NlpD